MAKVLKEETTLEDQQSSLETENTVLGYLIYGEIPLGVLLTLYGLYGYIAQNSMTFLVVGLIVAGLGVSHHLKIKENEKSIAQIESGRSGEAEVSRLLDDELPDSFYLLNDVDVQSAGREAQNDHLLIAPGGIFVVETKAYAGKLIGDAEDEHWTQERGDSTKSVTNPIHQNEYHREVLLEVLDRHSLPFEPDDVHSFIAMTNGECDWRIQGDTSNLDYAWNLPETIREIGQEAKYLPEDRDKLVEILGLEPPETKLHKETDSAGRPQADTEATTTEEEERTTEQATTPETPTQQKEQRWWVYRDESVSDRTYNIRELKSMNISPETQVCPQDGNEWIRADEVEGLTFQR